MYMYMYMYINVPLSGSGNNPGGAGPSRGLFATGGVCRSLWGETCWFFGDTLTGLEIRDGGAIGPRLLQGEIFSPEILKSDSFSFERSLPFHGLVFFCWVSWVTIEAEGVEPEGGCD